MKEMLTTFGLAVGVAAGIRACLKWRNKLSFCLLAAVVTGAAFALSIDEPAVE